MKAVILAAGKGSRLGSITENIPKCMLKLNDKHTLLSYNVSLISEMNINSIIIITGFKSDKIEKYIKELSKKYQVDFEKSNSFTLDQ